MLRCNFFSLYKYIFNANEIDLLSVASLGTKNTCILNFNNNHTQLWCMQRLDEVNTNFLQKHYALVQLIFLFTAILLRRTHVF